MENFQELIYIQKDEIKRAENLCREMSKTISIIKELAESIASSNKDTTTYINTKK